MTNKFEIGTVINATLAVDGANVVAKIIGYEGTIHDMPVYTVIEIAGECIGVEYSVFHGEIK